MLTRKAHMGAIMQQLFRRVVFVGHATCGKGAVASSLVLSPCTQQYVAPLT